MRGHICADLIFSCNKLGGLGVGGARMKTRYIIIYLGKKTSELHFQSVLTGIWAISQPGEVCILMWFSHIPYPQLSSFHCSEIPQNFISFRENIGRKCPTSAMFSRGFLHTKEILFEMENNPSIEKVNSCCSLFSVIWISLQLNSFKMFQAGIYLPFPTD